MYPVTVIGDNVTARAVILALARSGIEQFSWARHSEADSAPQLLPAHTLSANLSRVISALGRESALLDAGHQPDREQVRFAASGYLLSELPLGKFASDRYGAAHINIEHSALMQVLTTDGLHQPIAPIQSLTDQHPANAHPLVVDTRRVPDVPAPTHQLWYACLDNQQQPDHANITWLGDGATGWQFSTRQHDHFLFSTPLGQPLQTFTWHNSLGNAVNQATAHASFAATLPEPAETWYQGNVTFAGPARLAQSPFCRHAAHIGLEDAWVLSRMVENYEEEVAHGLAEYEKYRRARNRRLIRHVNEESRLQRLPSGIARLQRNLAIALRTRFLPEIAMQRIDWLYGFDCIRGFR